MQIYPKILSVQNCLQGPIFKIGLLLNQRTTHNLHAIIKVTFAHITYMHVLSWEGSILKEIFQCKDGSKFELFLLGFDPQPIKITLTSISSTR